MTIKRLHHGFVMSKITFLSGRMFYNYIFHIPGEN